MSKEWKEDDQGEEQTPDEFIASLPKPVQERVTQLLELQKQHSELESKLDKEIEEIEGRYEQLYKPLYTQRSAALKEGEPLADFWLIGLKRNAYAESIITEKDEQVLKFLEDIESESLTGEKGFKLIFRFKENPFFEETVLEKSYIMDEDEEDSSDITIKDLKGTKITWKPGKNVTVELVKKKQRHKGRGEVRVVTKEEPIDSFFNFFSPPQIPGEDADEETLEDIERIIDADYEVGSFIKERLIPNAVDFYLGEGVDDEDEDEDYEDDGEGEDDDEDYEDDEDDEDEEEEKKPAAKPTKKGGVSGGAKPAAANEQAPECKQQ